MTTLDEYKTMTPCDILDQLKFAKFKRLNGETPKRLRYRSDTGAEREIDTLNITIEALNSAISEYDSLCNISKGDTTGRRRCFTAGY